MAADQSRDTTFRKSTAGLVLAVLTLVIGVAGVIWSIAVQNWSALIPLLAVISLGAFLLVMQRSHSSRHG